MLVSPSILSANFLNLERDIRQLEEAGANFIHIDIMDGRFVANVTWGPSTVNAISTITALPLDVHLMIEQPERFLDDYIQSNANIICIHPESTLYLRKTLHTIKRAGVKAGVALKLETPVHTIQHCLDIVDVILFLTSDEGFGGQTFHPFALEKISQVAKWRTEQKYNYLIEVDGGITPHTARQCKEAGADIVVAGSYIFRHDMTAAIRHLQTVK